MKKDYHYHPAFRPFCRAVLTLFSDHHVIHAENYIDPPFIVTTNHIELL